jgi:hypothetical protein
MRHRAPWDYEQAAEAKHLLDEGVTVEEVAYHMGRTADGVRKAIFNFFGPQRAEAVDRYTVGPAIGRTMECQRLERDARLGSIILAQAVNDLINSMDPAQVALMLGAAPNVIPGRERIHKTCSVLGLRVAA